MVFSFSSFLSISLSLPVCLLLLLLFSSLLCSLSFFHRWTTVLWRYVEHRYVVVILSFQLRIFIKGKLPRIGREIVVVICSVFSQNEKEVQLVPLLSIVLSRCTIWWCNTRICIYTNIQILYELILSMPSVHSIHLIVMQYHVIGEQYWCFFFMLNKQSAYFLLLISFAFM